MLSGWLVKLVGLVGLVGLVLKGQNSLSPDNLQTPAYLPVVIDCWDALG
jgi:hypothetical protein